MQTTQLYNRDIRTVYSNGIRRLLVNPGWQRHHRIGLYSSTEWLLEACETKRKVSLSKKLVDFCSLAPQLKSDIFLKLPIRVALGWSWYSRSHSLASYVPFIGRPLFKPPACPLHPSLQLGMFYNSTDNLNTDRVISF